MDKETVDIANLSHPASINEPPAYGKTMPSGIRAMGSFDAAFDGRKPIYQDLTLLRDFRPLKQGQKYGQRGSTVYNPKPEDPDQEEIYGKRKYKEKISQEDPRAVIDKMKKQEDKITELQTQLDTLIKLMSQNTSIYEEPVNTYNELVEYKDMKYQELVKLAKARGIENLKAISKEDVIAKLQESDNES